MVKTLLEQAIEHKVVPVGSTLHPKACGPWRRIIRPKGTACPFGKVHKTNNNCRIRCYDNDFQICCFAKSCDKEERRSMYVDTACGLTEEDYAEMVAPKTYTADMF